MNARLPDDRLPACAFNNRPHAPRHAFTFPVSQGLSILIDLDRLADADRQSMLFSVDRFNLLSLRQSDYGPTLNKGSHVQLATYAREMAAEICPDHDIDKVLLLTFPRILAVAFNPVSIYCW